MEVNNQLLKIYLNLILDLQSLEFLDLSGNQLTEPPTEIWDLVGLRQLYLSDNSLAEVQTYRIDNLVSC